MSFNKHNIKGLISNLVCTRNYQTISNEIRSIGEIRMGAVHRSEKIISEKEQEVLKKMIPARTETDVIGHQLSLKFIPIDVFLSNFFKISFYSELSICFYGSSNRISGLSCWLL